MPNKILVIVGPTASGKSALAVLIAKKFDGEIISADSRQVYKGLNVGTAKITHKEMNGVRHHLLNVSDSKKQFGVVDYVERAGKAIVEINKRGKLPIVVGGTGFYVQALVDGVIFPDVRPNLDLRKKLRNKSAEELFKILKKLDPSRAENIDIHNTRRLIRSIEMAQALGKMPKIPNPKATHRPLFIGLTLPKDKLRQHINARLSRDLKRGLIRETRKLHANGLSWKRLEEIGLQYRLVSKYLRGFISKKEMTEKLKTELWHYAKRQMTWFKRDKRIRWFDPVEMEAISNTVENFVSAGDGGIGPPIAVLETAVIPLN